jgi:hypothetical protein
MAKLKDQQPNAIIEFYIIIARCIYRNSASDLDPEQVIRKTGKIYNILTGCSSMY